MPRPPHAASPPPNPVGGNSRDRKPHRSDSQPDPRRESEHTALGAVPPTGLNSSIRFNHDQEFDRGYVDRELPEQQPVNKPKLDRRMWTAMLLVLVISLLAVIAALFVFSWSKHPGEVRPVRSTAAKLPNGNIADLKWPDQIQGVAKSGFDEPGGPTVSIASYGNPIRFSGALVRDSNAKDSTANLQDLKEFAGYRCGKETTMAKCVADVKGGMIVLVSGDNQITIDDLGGKMRDLLQVL